MVQNPNGHEGCYKADKKTRQDDSSQKPDDGDRSSNDSFGVLVAIADNKNINIRFCSKRVQRLFGELSWIKETIKFGIRKTVKGKIFPVKRK